MDVWVHSAGWGWLRGYQARLVTKKGLGQSYYTVGQEGSWRVWEPCNITG